MLSSGRAPSTAPRGLCFQPSAKLRAAGLQGGGAQQVDLEVAGGHDFGIARAHEAHTIAAAAADRLLFDALRGTARRPVALHAAEHVLQHAVAPLREDHAGAQRALDRGGRKILTAGAGREGRNVQALARRAIPIRGVGGILERHAAAGEILREAAPTGEIQLLGVLELREIAFQARTFGQQAEDAPLVEHVDVVLPDHVVDGAEFAAVTDQQRGQACEAIAHQCTSGSRMESAKPARKTGCAKPSGATSAAEPRGTPSAYRTEPSATI